MHSRAFPQECSHCGLLQIQASNGDWALLILWGLLWSAFHRTQLQSSTHTPSLPCLQPRPWVAPWPLHRAPPQLDRLSRARAGRGAVGAAPQARPAEPPTAPLQHEGLPVSPAPHPERKHTLKPQPQEVLSLSGCCSSEEECGGEG